MKIRVTSVGNDGDGGWLIEFTRIPEEAHIFTESTVIQLTRGEEKPPIQLDAALNEASGIARIYFGKMDEFNKRAESHGG
jgi:hypothetical protein